MTVTVAPPRVDVCQGQPAMPLLQARPRPGSEDIIDGFSSPGLLGEGFRMAAAHPAWSHTLPGEASGYHPSSTAQPLPFPQRWWSRWFRQPQQSFPWQGSSFLGLYPMWWVPPHFTGQETEAEEQGRKCRVRVLA